MKPVACRCGRSPRVRRVLGLARHKRCTFSGLTSDGAVRHRIADFITQQRALMR